MANAIVIGFRGSDGDSTPSFFIIPTFLLYGADVPRNIVGRPQETSVELLPGYSLLDVKNNIVAAVRGAALELGVTIAAGDLDLPAYESG